MSTLLKQRGRALAKLRATSKRTTLDVAAVLRQDVGRRFSVVEISNLVKRVESGEIDAILMIPEITTLDNTSEIDRRINAWSRALATSRGRFESMYNSPS